jgi:hypothetical protein
MLLISLPGKNNNCLDHYKPFVSSYILETCSTKKKCCYLIFMTARERVPLKSSKTLIVLTILYIAAKSGSIYGKKVARLTN